MADSVLAKRKTVRFAAIMQLIKLLSAGCRL